MRIIQKISRKKIFTVLGMLLIPALLFYMEAYFTYVPFGRTGNYAQALNILVLELLLGVLLFCTGSAVWALRIETVFVMIVGIANYYVISFRGNPVVPWDILSLKTAAGVAGGYDYGMGVRQIVLIVLFLLLVFAERYIVLRIDRKRWIGRIAGVAGCLLLVVAVTAALWQDSMVSKWKLYPFLFTPNAMYERNGFAVTFLMDLKYMAVEKPEGYDSATAEEVLKPYQDSLSWTDVSSNDAKQEQTETLPNIIVIMDEAFSDPVVLGEFETTEDYMPYLHSLQQGQENTISGYLHVSVKGGNTANTEFEFLTGQTMAFLPAGSIPYQQYVTGERPSLASYLKSLGYTAQAMHPYYGMGWNRNTVYPDLGFDEFYDVTSYANAAKLRGYVSDSSCVDKVIELYENREKEKPLFLFQVTMQNHSPYTDGYLAEDGNIAVKGDTSQQLSEYLTLMKRSDEALEKLLTYFEKQTEPTLIVFFGDHQPTDSVVSPIYRLNDKNASLLTMEEEQQRYQVPYIIWANYEIEAQTGADTSANYLAAKALQAGGVPLADYQKYLLDLSEEYPVVSTLQTTAADGSEADTKQGSLLAYRRLQYYLLFDWKQKKE